MGKYYLRQSATVAFGPTTGTDYQRNAVLGLGCLGTANSRLVICQAVSGPGHGANGSIAPCGISITNFGIDVGNDDTPNTFSSDIVIWDEIAGDAGGTDVIISVGSAFAGSYCAAWVGEYTQMDQSNYGYSGNKANYNGNVDYDASFGASGSGSTVNCDRTGGNTCNYNPELGIWMVAGKGPARGISSVTYTEEGTVDDGGNIWLYVQDQYFNVAGLYNPVFNLVSAASYWNWYNFTMKTLAYPIGAGKPRVDLSGFGTPAPGIRL